MEIEFLLDTNIIIYHLNGDEIASNFIDNHFDRTAISFITYIEVLSFPFETEELENQVRQLMNSFKKISITKEVEEETIQIKRLKKIKLPDALIASISKIRQFTLVTRNEKDFKNLNIAVLNPFG
jgi:predicted nucleic acid-binding protein